MKARDLAALAALGVAGKYAYDKFSEKNAPKKKMGEGLDMTNQGAYERATVPKSANEDVEMGTKGAYLPETPEYRTRGAYLDETPEYRTKGAYLDETPQFRTKGAYLDERDTPVAVARPVPTPVIQARPLAAAPAPAPVQTQLVYDNDAPVAQRLAAINAANGADSESAQQTDALANTSRAALLVDRANKINPTAMQASGVSTPSARATDKLAMTSRANQAAYLAQQRAEQARLDALRASGGRRAKGGVVKMASGGLASSKMSKPSGASRGDGIAQRGRTRGKYL